MQEPDFLILDTPIGETPNLLSVSRTSGRDDSVFVFTAKGAVRTKLPPNDLRLLAQITERAVQENRFAGRANVVNGLYIQDFGAGDAK